MNFLKKIWTERPLLMILVIGLLVRYVSVFFAKGFGMHDDHFLVIEAAQSWADGTDYNDWLPSSKINAQPTGHSLFYVGLHYLIFLFLNFIHVYEPQSRMLIIRFLHSLLSLLVIYYGYKITLRVSGEKLARKTGLLLAILWFMPWLSVRNLVEVVCIPFLIYGTWLIMNTDTKRHKDINMLYAGFMLGFSTSIRYQTFMFVFGIIIALFMLKQYKNSIFVLLGLIISFSLIQGIIDIYIWKRPFAEFMEYVRYNINNSNDYVTNSWYSYLLLITGILIPPISIFLLIGFFSQWKKNLLLFLPSFLFLLFHSFFPNKQERFILPLIPFIIILGMIGWNEIAERKFISQKSKNILKSCWIFFFIVNLILLPFVSTMYSKRARVESMTYLSHHKHIVTLLIEDSNHSSAKMPPQFYLGQWVHVCEINEVRNADSLKSELDSASKFIYPRYVLFFEDKNIVTRIKNVKNIFPDLKFEKVILPGLIDDLLYKINPINSNQTIYIFKTF